MKRILANSNYGIIFVLVVLVLVFTIIEPSFIRTTSLINVARQISAVGICAVGMAIVMLSGGIDLSIGSLIALVNIVCANLIIVQEINPVVAILISLVMALLVGALNAFWITAMKIPPLIATLGMMSILRGLAYVISDGRALWGFSESFRFLGRGKLGGVPIPVLFMIAVFGLGWLFLTRTRWGRFVYGMGRSETAAKLSGINIVGMKLLVYCLCSLLSAFSGILLLSRINTGLPKIGTGMEMEVITAVVLGGVSIYGGKGSIQGVFIGVVIMGVLTNGMTFLNITEYLQLVISGLVLLLAIGFDNISKTDLIR